MTKPSQLTFNWLWTSPSSCSFSPVLFCTFSMSFFLPSFSSIIICSSVIFQGRIGASWRSVIFMHLVRLKIQTAWRKIGRRKKVRNHEEMKILHKLHDQQHSYTPSLFLYLQLLEQKGSKEERRPEELYTSSTLPLLFLPQKQQPVFLYLYISPSISLCLWVKYSARQGWRQFWRSLRTGGRCPRGWLARSNGPTGTPSMRPRLVERSSTRSHSFVPLPSHSLYCPPSHT